MIPSRDKIKTCMGCGTSKTIDQFGAISKKSRWGKISLFTSATCLNCISNGVFRPVQQLKRCVSCGNDKQGSEFYRHAYTTSSGKKGTRYESSCKECKEIKGQARVRANREKYQESRAKSYAKRRGEKAAKAKVYYQTNKLEIRKKTRGYHLVGNYGITEQQYQQLLVSQEGRCVICSIHEDDAPRGILMVDHNHQTGKVRGLLCHNCNVACGLLRDDPETARKLADYLCRNST